MNQSTRRNRTDLSILAALLGSVSAATLAGTLSAHAQGATAAVGQIPVEEVLVTGSLIRGAPAVGVPVTSLSDQDFKETGALTISDMLKSVPAVNVQPSNAMGLGGFTAEKAQAVTIHGLSTGSSTETLMMIDGMRYPVQGHGTCYVDPSIIPTLAVDHLDVLADGASATYGSDAVAGVINVVLKRGFQGATSQLRMGESTDLGGFSIQASQLYGRTWDGGDVTVSYEFYNQDNVSGPGRSYFTYNFEPWGLDDLTPLASSNPAVVTTGAAARPADIPAGFSPSSGTRFCTNCFSVPKGQNGVGLTWAQLQANPGVKNEVNPYTYSDILPAQQRNAVTMTFDQDIMPGVQFFATAFYSNRQALARYQPGASPGRENLITGRPVPTSNPYYPIGAPAGLRVNYNLGPELQPRASAGEIAGRWDAGVNLSLPFDWHGRLYYSRSEDQNYMHSTGMANTNNILAALGNTVASVAASGNTPGQAAFTKPANVPYLNLFCDPKAFTCNSQVTLNYISAYRRYDEKWELNEYGGTFDGGLFEIPGGTVKAAVGGNYVTNNWYFNQAFNYSTPSTAIVTKDNDPEHIAVWAAYGQLSIPVVGENNRIPLVEGLDFELAFRHDQYDKFGGVDTPKVAGNWRVGYGLTMRGAWGKAFRAPGFGEATSSATILSNNILGGNATNGTATCAVGVPIQAGSLAARLNPTCSSDQSLQFPAVISVTGGAGGAAVLRTPEAQALRQNSPANGLSPETAKNWNVGFNWAPPGLLSGVQVDVTKYHLRVDNLLAANTPGTGPNDTSTNGQYIVITDPSQPITAPVNTGFYALVQAMMANPRYSGSQAIATSVKLIVDNAITNIGYRLVEGYDFNLGYDWDLGNDIGAANVGLSGNYADVDESQPYPGAPVNSVYDGKNSGSRMKYRARLGWTSPDSEFAVTGFVNYRGHGANAATSTTPFVPPACYWAAGYSAGSCYAGSGYYGPYTVYPNLTPAQFTLDVTMQYQTGTRPANTYLQNLSVQFTMNNVLNAAPPFFYDSRGRGGTPHAFSPEGFDPNQRTVNLIITKNW